MAKLYFPGSVLLAHSESCVISVTTLYPVVISLTDESSYTNSTLI